MNTCICKHIPIYSMYIYSHVFLYIYVHIKIRVNNNTIHKHIFCTFTFSHRYTSYEHFYVKKNSNTQHLLATHEITSNSFLRHDKACFCHLGDSARDDAGVGLQHSGRRSAHITFHCVCFTRARLFMWCEV